MKISLYCRCGAGATYSISSPEAAQKFVKVWYQEHKGAGHGDCEKEEAVAAFRRKHAYDPEPQHE